MTCKTINGKKFCTTFDEALKQDRQINGGWSDSVISASEEAVDFVKGVGDTASSIIRFPENVLKYITCTDRYLGESRSWSYFGNSLSLRVNPLVRTIDTANSMFYGAIDILTGHAPYLLFNQTIGLNIPYFSPPPQDARGFGRDISMGAFILALPSVKTKVYNAAGIKPKSKPVTITNPLKKIPPQSVPAPVLSIVLSNLGWLKRARNWIKKIRLLKAHEHIIKLIDRLGPKDVSKLDELVLKKLELFTSEHITKIINRIKDGHIGFKTLIKLVQNKSEIFTVEHVTEMIRHAEGCSWKYGGFEALKKLAHARPELFARTYMPKVIDSAGITMRGAELIETLADNRPDLFITEDIPNIMRVAQIGRGRADVLDCLARKRPELFNKEHIPELIKVAKKGTDAVEAIYLLAKAKPDLFDTPEIKAAIESHVYKIIKRGIGEASVRDTSVLRKLPDLIPEIFRPSHITRIVELLGKYTRGEQQGYETLIKLARKKPELFGHKHFPQVIDYAGQDMRAAYLLETLSETRPEIFTKPDIKNTMMVAKIGSGKASVLDNLAQSRPKLFGRFSSDLIADLVDVAETGNDGIKAIIHLAKTKPNYFSRTAFNKLFDLAGTNRDLLPAVKVLIKSRADLLE